MNRKSIRDLAAKDLNVRTAPYKVCSNCSLEYPWNVSSGFKMNSFSIIGI
jgi:formate-dependent phosphoribosylglycinamide formyltransferase (GAR transformylase)